MNTQISNQFDAVKDEPPNMSHKGGSLKGRLLKLYLLYSKNLFAFDKKLILCN